MKHYLTQKKCYKFFLSFFFILYIFVLLYLLFFASEFSRDHISMMNGNYLETLRQQWNSATNLHPFKTIHTMIQIYHNPYYSNMIAHTNLYGNIIIFMPFSFFSSTIISFYEKSSSFSTFYAFSYHPRRDFTAFYF